MGCFIKYSPILSHNLGYDRSAIILDRLEYWFSKYTSSFYKFVEPCSHPCYREGDSLQEELCISRKVFNKAFDLIGVRYKSKTAFLEESNPFKGKLYAMYMDRQTHKTHFVRNNEFAKSILEKLFSPLKRTPVNTDSHVSNSEGLSNLSKKGNSRNCPLGRSPIYKDIQKNTSSSSKTTFETKKKEEEIKKELLDIWMKRIGEIGGSEKASSYLQSKLLVSFQSKFDGSIDKWTAYCQKIASSKFLMGEGDSKFFKKAWLSWAIKEGNIDKINSDHFTYGDRETPETLAEKERVREIKDLRAKKTQIEHDVEEIKQAFEHEKNRLSKATYTELTEMEKEEIQNSFVNHIKENSTAQYETFKSYGLEHPILSMSYEFYWREIVVNKFTSNEYKKIKKKMDVRLNLLENKLGEIAVLIQQKKMAENKKVASGIVKLSK